MPSSPKISVIIPAYNAARYINQAIDSVLAQNYANLEILIADDSSTDNTLEILHSYTDPRITVIENDANLGYLRTFNKLLTLAMGEYFAFVDADDFWAPDKLRFQLEAFDQDPELSICSTNFHRVDEQGNIVETSNSSEDHESILRNLSASHDIDIAVSTVMIKRKVYDTLGGYREYFIGCAAEDFDWIRRITEIYKICNISQPLYNYRFHANSLTRTVNFEVRKRHISEIVFFLANQRKSRVDNSDDLMTGDHTELERFISTLELPYKRDLSMIYRKTGFEYALIGHYGQSFKNLQKAIYLKPLNLQNYKALIMSFVVIILPRNILFKLKTAFGVSHVSQNL